MEIIRGRIPCAKKVLVYGPEGIGKSTFASRFPDPLFIDTEGSTKEMDVARTPAPSSWSMLMEQARYVKEHPEACRTLAIDTADWAEMLCIDHILAKYQQSSIEGFGYGKGYTYVQEEFGRLLNLLEEVVGKGVNIVLTAHAKMRKFEQPDEMGAYDRWETKLSKGVAPMVKEWADIVLFANYKTYSVAVDDKGKKRKAQGGSRVMYTSHHPCWDAKNRYSLPEEMPFDYSGIAGIIGAPVATGDAGTSGAKGQEEASYTDRFMDIPEEHDSAPPASAADTAQEQVGTAGGTAQMEGGRQASLVWESDPDKVPQNLKDLMMADGVCEWDIQNVVGARGYYPADVPIQGYDPGFVQGVLVGAWAKVHAMIKEMKASGEIPFN